MHGCPDCLTENPSHCGRMMYLGSRRHLPADSPLRARRCGVYHFVTDERRGPPARRTTASMKLCLQIAKDDNLQHVFGFTRLPMLSARLGFDYILDCPAEWMHALARIFTMFAGILFGGHGESTRAKTWNSAGTDHKHRLQCEALNIFPSVWVNRRITLTDEQREVLLRPSDEDINDATRPRFVSCFCISASHIQAKSHTSPSHTSLEAWLRVVGENTNNQRVNALRQKVHEIRQRIVQDGDDFTFTPRRLAPLPWRLSREAFNQVDRRIQNMVFPYKTEPVTKNGRSFLNFTAASNKTSKKILCLLVILPTVLRGYVQALRRGLRLIVLGLRMLEGQVYTHTPRARAHTHHDTHTQHHAHTHTHTQVHSYNKCVRLGVEPGSRCFDTNLVSKIQKLLVTGIAMVTGSVPPATIVACLHLLCHYAGHAELFGILRWYMMMVFERYNRFVKQMCRNTHWVLQSIAQTYKRMAAEHHLQIAECLRSPKTTCTLLGRQDMWKDPPDAVVTFLFGSYSCQKRIHPIADPTTHRIHR